MKSTIKQMFLGEKGNYDNVKFTEEYDAFLDKTVALEQEFKVKFESNPEIFKFYLKISNAVEKLNAEVTTANYVEGFKLGVLLGLELSRD
ncbi:MAG: hypothetical protein FWC82_01785 [Firmicutes bacterium]|nr:hypothetical protein [Bacillota bacterium]